MSRKQSFEIMTDSTANLPDGIIVRQELSILSLTYTVDGVEYRGYQKGKGIPAVPVYDMMRSKKEIRTSLVNGQEAYDAAEQIVKKGQDILYVGLSSGLSGTFQAVQMAFTELQEEYPERSLIAVDSLSAAMGEGILVRRAVQMREEGCTIRETAEWLQENLLHVCHEFTVEDLFFLKRGGRIGTAAAVLGSALKVKPVLYVDDEGHLTPAGKVRGRKKSLDALADRMEQKIVSPEEQTVYIAHGDCLADADYLADKIRRRIPAKKIQVEMLEPVLGAHSGPGTVGLFYIGEHR